ncbi:hypothetical protein [Cupriavidus sp. IK-TO18]|uniref:hypothetical protein n=1 Tax=Cupriavidus sp. IK-TO18 TaxID=2782182 RepID=UPI00189925C7|nr:hypothetical protein [Cupriavidus sp. IK-TO18]MBF6987240.1 hypothetical protein [Cupriavidus sp. IK-TO18]
MTNAAVTILQEAQQSPVADIYSAHIAIVRPILSGLLYSLKQDVVAEVGGYKNVKLKMLPRLRREGDGDVGICFEYAVHDALRRRHPNITERIYDALTRYCRVPGAEIDSILFAAEKNGSLQLIDTATGVLTDESRILTGAQAQPPKLKQYLSDIARAFRSSTFREMLPSTIKGLWKADLFVGCRDSDRWVGTTVKINPAALEGAPGLRLGIVPSMQGRHDNIRFDQAKNLVVCPVPYDASFMEAFYISWGIVKQFLDADANMPREVFLPSPFQRQVANELVIRREFDVVDVIEALQPLAQPHLLINNPQDVRVDVEGADMTPDTIISPIPGIIV